MVPRMYPKTTACFYITFLYRAPYYNGKPNIGPRIIRNLDQYPHELLLGLGLKALRV